MIKQIFRRGRKQSFEGEGIFRGIMYKGKRSLLFIPDELRPSIDYKPGEYKGKLLEILLRPDTSEEKIEELTGALNLVVQAVRVSDFLQRAEVEEMPACLFDLCESINNRQKITYGQLANKLGLRLSKHEWNALLDQVAEKTKREIDIDLTWNVVYSSGPAKGLGRYFSNEGTTRSMLLDPKDPEQVANYERKLKEIYEYFYNYGQVRGEDRVMKSKKKFW